LGLITALPNVVLTILFGITLGGLVSGLLIVSRRVTLKTYIPYGPFLIIAGWIVLVWGDVLYRRFWG
jgi:leader peptidase (prepilin peptidase)/N-methyltransferase